MEQLYSAKPQGPTSLFIGGLSKETSLREIIEYVEQFGSVVNIHMPLHKVTGKPVGYAFVQLADPQLATWLVNRANKISGRIVDIQFAIEREEKETYKLDLLRRKIFIAGIKHFVRFDHIQEALQEYGHLKIFYRIETSHKNRGLAFAEYFESDSAERVVSQGLIVDGCPLRVSYFRPKPESDLSVDPHLGTDRRRPSGPQDSPILGRSNPISSENLTNRPSQEACQSHKVREELSNVPESGPPLIGENNYTFRIAVNGHLQQTAKKIKVKGAMLYLKSDASFLNSKKNLIGQDPRMDRARKSPSLVPSSDNQRSLVESPAKPEILSQSQDRPSSQNNSNSSKKLS